MDCINDCRRVKGFLLYGLVIMLNHIHFIGSAREAGQFSEIVGALKKRTSMEIYKQMKKDNEHWMTWMCDRGNGTHTDVWQHNGHSEIISSEKNFVHKLEHIHYNPVRKGYVLKPEDWKYSSARNWLLGDHSIMSLDLEELLKPHRNVERKETIMNSRALPKTEEENIDHEGYKDVSQKVKDLVSV
jgi:putative transposase